MDSYIAPAGSNVICSPSRRVLAARTPEVLRMLTSTRAVYGQNRRIYRGGE